VCHADLYSRLRDGSVPPFSRYVTLGRYEFYLTLFREVGEDRFS
jgi:hypothetical protein